MGQGFFYLDFFNFFPDFSKTKSLERFEIKF